MIVSGVEMKAPARRQVSGCIISFVSQDNIKIGTKLELPFENKSHYFEVDGQSITERNALKITAHEVGYYATKFDRNEDFDVRSLIGAEVETVTDPAVISKINEMSSWC